MSIVFTSQKEQDCIDYLVTYSFLQVGSESGLSPCEELPVVLTWKHMIHSGGVQRPLDMNNFHGLHSAKPSRGYPKNGSQHWHQGMLKGQKLCGPITKLYNLFLKAGSKDCRNAREKSQGSGLLSSFGNPDFSCLCATASRN